MHSRSDSSTQPNSPPPEPPRARRSSSRSRGGRRRVPPVRDERTYLVGSPEALYRAEKARRAGNVDSAVMAEAKRLYDEAVAETTMKRAGMRSAVVPPSQRRSNAPNAPNAPNANAA